MKRLGASCTAMVLLVTLVAVPAMAQEPPFAPPPAPAPEVVQEDQLAVFQMERGFFLSADLGVFFTFGGTKAVSNIQPSMAVTGGYDFNEMFSVQARVSTTRRNALRISTVWPSRAAIDGNSHGVPGGSAAI